MMEAEAEAGSG